MEIDKRMMDVVQSIRDDKAMELFGRTEAGLSYVERLELDDWLSPKWKDVETKYGNVEVSNVGQVRDPVTKGSIKIYHTVVNNEKHYPLIALRDTDGKRKPQTVHRLVAQAFCPNDDPKNKREVNHIDGDKTHNWYYNLEWVTPAENAQHAFRTGLNVALKGEEAGRAIITESQVKNICDLLCKHPDWTIKKIYQETGVPQHIISSIYNKYTWKDVTKDYDFPPRQTQVKGENHGMAKYTNDQIRYVCELLRDHPEWTEERIANEAGVATSLIGEVYRRKHWTEISRDFIFPCRKTRNTIDENMAEKICCMLDKRIQQTNINIDDIANTCGVTLRIVYNINEGNTWTNISMKHPFYKAKFGDQAKQGPANNS